MLLEPALIGEATPVWVIVNALASVPFNVTRFPALPLRVKSAVPWFLMVKIWLAELVLMA